MQLSQSLTKSEKVPSTLIEISGLFGNVVTMTGYLLKSVRPLYHIAKKGRPYSTLTGKMGRPNSNIAKKCFFGG